MTLDELNGLELSQAEAEFARCCGSSRWAKAMTAGRPFASLHAMQERAGAIWASLGSGDWLEAFAAHPQIGEQRVGASWSTAEQAGVASAGDETKARLAGLNRDYQRRFGYIFIVCATGRPADELLAALGARLVNDPETELAIAAAEQRKITGLRLEKLVGAHA